MEATAGWVEEGEPGDVGCSTQVIARTDDDLTPDDRARQGSHVECIAGALTINDYRHHLTTAGFIDIDITTTQPVGHKIYSAIIRASKLAPRDPGTPRP